MNRNLLLILLTLSLATPARGASECPTFLKRLLSYFKSEKTIPSDPAIWAAEGYTLPSLESQKYVFGNLELGQSVRFIDATTGQARELRFVRWDPMGNAVMLDEATQKLVTVPDMMEGFNKLYEPGTLHVRKGLATPAELAAEEKRLAALKAQKAAEDAKYAAKNPPKPKPDPAQLAKTAKKLAPQLGDLSQLSRADLEREMAALVKKDPQFLNPDNEALHYLLMREYSKHVPQYNTVQALIDAGILKVRDGEFVSDYAMSYTHLGVLSVEDAGAGSVHVLKNRGTGYFRGTDHPAFGGHILSAPDYMKSATAKAVFAETDLTVVVAAPAEPAAAQIHFPVDGPEVILDVEKLPEVRIFHTDVSYLDLRRYLNKLKKGL